MSNRLNNIEGQVRDINKMIK
ncbi:MAG: metal-sensing transcriptional repressor [Candidatus Latescibacteria bacterium]|nr:metal-sensing transcriptional repressor [Candidatus Latescibacterota bacterium]